MNLSTLIARVVGDVDDKKRWWAYKARAKRLPAPYRDAMRALDRYLMYYGALPNGGLLMTMLEDLADLFEQAAADGTPIRTIVGDDPVEFAEDFLRTYAEGQWISKERARLVAAIDRATAAENRPEETR